MKVRATLTPGQDGTNQPHKTHDDQLACVHYYNAPIL